MIRAGPRTGNSLELRWPFVGRAKGVFQTQNEIHKHKFATAAEADDVEKGIPKLERGTGTAKLATNC